MEGSSLDVWSSFKFSNETDFEKILLQSNLLKRYEVYDAKITLNKDGGYNRYPDVVLFHNSRKYWSIGEVEIAEHSFENHVFPQLVEIFTLVERNTEFIREQFLHHPVVINDKSLRDLIMFNKPFITLISDRFPSKHINSISLLKNICNVSIVTRFKDSNENYIYACEEYPMNEIKKDFSYCLINYNLLFIERPNILSMHTDNHKWINYNGEQIQILAHNEIINGQKRLFWILDKNLRQGKYKLSLNNNELKLSK